MKILAGIGYAVPYDWQALSMAKGAGRATASRTLTAMKVCVEQVVFNFTCFDVK